MDRSTPTEPRHSDSVHYLLDESRYRAGVRRADPEAVPGDSHRAFAAEEQAQEELELSARDERMLPRRVVHQLPGYRLERLDSTPERISRLLLPRILFHGSFLNQQWLALQQRYQSK